MKQLLILAVLLIAAIIAGTAYLNHPMKEHFGITSSAFDDGASIPPDHTCSGRNISPPISIMNPPEGAKSLVLIMDDPDAPGGSWTHWVRLDIPAGDHDLLAGQDFPDAVRGKGSGGSLDYEGPCPPSGTHRYYFKVYALDTMLGLSEGAAAMEIEAAMHGHVIASAELGGLFKKQ